MRSPTTAGSGARCQACQRRRARPPGQSYAGYCQLCAERQSLERRQQAIRALIPSGDLTPPVVVETPAGAFDVVWPRYTVQKEIRR